MLLPLLSRMLTATIRLAVGHCPPFPDHRYQWPVVCSQSLLVPCSLPCGSLCMSRSSFNNSQRDASMRCNVFTRIVVGEICVSVARGYPLVRLYSKIYYYFYYGHSLSAQTIMPLHDSLGINTHVFLYLCTLGHRV